MTSAVNLVEGLQKEMNRVRDLIPRYEELPGGAGRFAVLSMRAAIREAEKAMGAGDPVEMLRAYKSLEGFTV